MKQLRHNIPYRLFPALCFFVAAMICSVPLFAQQCKADVDRNNILIGEQLRWEVTVTMPESMTLVSISMPDSIAHMEYVSKPLIDSGLGQSTKKYSQRATVTSFDSGRWWLPPIRALVQWNGQTKTLVSDSIPIFVGYAAADSTQGLRDIKPLMEVEVVDYTYWYIAGAVLLLALLTWLLYRKVRNGKGQTKSDPVLRADALETAMKGLDTLSGTSPSLETYQQLYDLLRTYMTGRTGKNYFNDTTGDMLIRLSPYIPDQDERSSLAATLRLCDAVKFAKFQPPVAEWTGSVDSVRLSILAIESSLKQGGNHAV